MKNNNTIKMGNDARAMKEMEYVFTVSSGYHNATVWVTEICISSKNKKFLCNNVHELNHKILGEQNHQTLELFKLQRKSLHKVFLNPCRRSISKYSFLSWLALLFVS